jgi:hypothetical protein
VSEDPWPWGLGDPGFRWASELFEGCVEDLNSNLVIAVQGSEGVSFLKMADAVFYAGEVGHLVETFAWMYARESKYSQVSGRGLLEIACSLKWSVS